MILRIANSKGVPGTAGGFARARSGGPILLLTSAHVLFGRGAQPGETVWRVNGAEGARRYEPIAQTLDGTFGTVKRDGIDQFLDCAVAALNRAEAAGVAVERAGHSGARPGDPVAKTGAATGTTEGVVVSNDHLATAATGGRTVEAVRQIRIRSAIPGTPFSGGGDSGALVYDRDGSAIGLLWGQDSSGDSIACPIGPVLDSLNLQLLREC